MRIVYAKFHVMQHANQAVDEVRRAKFFRKGGRMRGLVKGKRWLLLTPWTNLDSRKRQLLNESVSIEPARDEGLPSEGKSRPALVLHLRRTRPAVSQRLGLWLPKTSSALNQ